MLVTVHATFSYKDMTRGFMKSIQMPASPAGVTELWVNIGTQTVCLTVDGIAWSEGATSFLVKGHAALTDATKAALDVDSDWEESIV